MLPRTLFASLALISTAALLPAQQNPRTVIRTEKREVLVDTVVTDKKGAVIRDLSAKDFKVWEDGKEQDIVNLSFQSAEATGENQRQYFVLFFDNATVKLADQLAARDAAAKFIARNAGPNRPMAVIEFGGTVRITQNFTTNVDRLKAAVARVQGSAINVGNDSGPAFPSLSSAGSDFGARSILLAIATVAKNLGAVPGRKTMALFTSGFPLTPELQSQVTAAIAACNRANVAVYPIDARGLTPGGPDAGQGGRIGGMAMLTPHTLFQTGAFAPPAAWLGWAMQRNTGSPGPAQNPGHTAGPAPTPSPSPSPTRTTPTFPTSPNAGTSTRPAPNFPTNPGRGNNSGTNTNTQPMPRNFPVDPLSNRLRKILPDIGDISGNQQVLHLLADGTGGFVILNTNDLLAGLEKIGGDQNAYYVLSYTPPESDEGSCHSLKVKVNKGGSNVRARTGYCNARQVDALAGESSGKALETRIAADAPGSVGANVELPYFYTAPDTALVNVALDIPADAFHFDKKKGKFKATLNILGIAYKDGQVAARFSDTVNLERESKKDVEALAGKQYFYETQFEIAPGKYDMKIAFESGDSKFGKLQRSLTIDPWNGKTIFMSGIAFAGQIRAVNQMGNALTAQMLDDRKPLIVEGIQITPAAQNRFRLDRQANGVYLEVYEPLFTGDKPCTVAVRVRVLDAKGVEKTDSGLFRVEPAAAGNPVVPLGLMVPIAGLAPGPYNLEISALDSAGNKIKRETGIQIE